jgi:hypothetical protein
LAAAGGSFGVDGDEEIGEDEEADGKSGEERLLLWCSLEAGVELLLLWCSLEAGVDGERAGSVGCGQNLPLLEVGCRAICEGGAGEGRLCWVLPAAEGKKMRGKKQGEGAGCAVEGAEKKIQGGDVRGRREACGWFVGRSCGGLL